MKPATGDPTKDPRFIGSVDLLRRSGARSFQIRYSDDEDPVVWMAVGSWLWADDRPVPAGTAGAHERHECAAALNPLTAILRLIEQIIDGGKCAHCGRSSAISDDWQTTWPTRIGDRFVCWYLWDPETLSFRRSCEGDT